MATQDGDFVTAEGLAKVMQEVGGGGGLDLLANHLNIGLGEFSADITDYSVVIVTLVPQSMAPVAHTVLLSQSMLNSPSATSGFYVKDGNASCAQLYVSGDGAALYFKPTVAISFVTIYGIK